MAHRLGSGALLVLLALTLGACGVKTAVPGFEYPVYDPDTPWPKLAPTQDLRKAADVDVQGTIEEVEQLKRLAI
jgi:hypothetical protein